MDLIHTTPDGLVNSQVTRRFLVTLFDLPEVIAAVQFKKLFDIGMFHFNCRLFRSTHHEYSPPVIAIFDATMIVTSCMAICHTASWIKRKQPECHRSKAAVAAVLPYRPPPERRPTVF
jgi:hypothetical protein